MNQVSIWFKSRNTIKNILGLLTGALGGFLYYRFVGCDGSCGITSNPWMSMLWGGILGYLLFDMIKLKEKQATPSTDQETGN